MKKINYRHYICIAITIGFLLCGVFVFRNALGRMIEGVRDLSVSFAYYFCEILELPFEITPTVNEFPKYPFFSFMGDYRSPVSIIPESWEQFKANWGVYWRLWITGDNFLGYLTFLFHGLYYVCYFILLVLPLGLVLYLLFRRTLNQENNDYNKDSKPLRFFKRFGEKVFSPAVRWIKEFYSFVRERKYYWVTWLCLWLYYFNAFTIAAEFFAFYLYFVISFDVVNIYRQVYKLFLDLWTVFDFIPLWCWIIIGIVVLSVISRKIGYGRLRHRERRNRGFINERGVVTIVYGNMGAGKTALITDIALSAEVQLRDQAFEIILECDMKFPDFPWILLENELRAEIGRHAVYDVWSCRRWIRGRQEKWTGSPCPVNIFGYDFEKYGITYDDKLKITDIWSVLEDYACAYLIYTVQSSLIISNYSIRTDNLKSDIGNFPLWDCDFFRRDSRLIDSYSRHAHILDFDMLRLGKKMLEDNPNRNAYGFGVYVITEIDKERKNTPELKEVKASAGECNQKNDLFNVLLKMSRHAVVISNRVFVKMIADLQRPDSLGADARELGEVVYIEKQAEMRPILPFFSPFWIFETAYLWLKEKFDGFYTQYRHNRGDNTLFAAALKKLTAAMARHYVRTCNLFGSAALSLLVENGRMDGETSERKYFRQSKKIWAKRYATDCLSGIFEARSETNIVGIDDLQEYADILAANDELQEQRSHFQNEVNALKEKK